MKKTISIICLILTFFIIYFLQVNFFSWFNIAGVKPNLFIIFILCIGLFIGKRVAIPFGILTGLYLDILTGSQVGISAILYCLIGFSGEYLEKNFSKDSQITILLMVAGATFSYELVLYIYNIIRNAIPLEIRGVTKILIIEIIWRKMK